MVDTSNKLQRRRDAARKKLYWVVAKVKLLRRNTKSTFSPSFREAFSEQGEEHVTPDGRDGEILRDLN